MKNFAALLLCLSISSALFAADQTETTEYKFKDFVEKFQKAPALTKISDLNLKWMSVLLVTNPETNENIYKYNPEGQYQSDDGKGFFVDLFDFRTKRILNKRADIETVYRKFGVPTGKLHKTVGPFTGTVSANGTFYNATGSQDYCSARVECRRPTTPQPVLLCAAENIDPECGEKRISRIWGFVKAPAELTFPAGPKVARNDRVRTVKRREYGETVRQREPREARQRDNPISWFPLFWLFQ